MPAPSILRFVPPRAGLYGSAMRGFFSNPRRALIVIHDLVMTAAAMLAAFYFRFEDIGLAQRLLGWRPLVTLEVGLGKTIDYFRTAATA